MGLCRDHIKNKKCQKTSSAQLRVKAYPENLVISRLLIKELLKEGGFKGYKEVGVQGGAIYFVPHLGELLILPHPENLVGICQVGAEI